MITRTPLPADDTTVPLALIPLPGPEHSFPYAGRHMNDISASIPPIPAFHVCKHTERPNYHRLLGPRGGSALICGDAAAILAAMPAGSAQTVITSPPYWSLRDYGIEGQLGLESSVYAFIECLVEVFEQVRRVLREDGALWLNIGDSYTSGGRTWRAPDKKTPRVPWTFARLPQRD